jgi:hypothetical protein
MALFVHVDKEGIAWTTVLVASASLKLSMLAPSTVPWNVPVSSESFEENGLLVLRTNFQQ